MNNQIVSLSDIEKTFARNGEINFNNGYIRFRLGLSGDKYYILEVEYDNESFYYSGTDKSKIIQNAYDVYMTYFAPITNVTGS